MTGDGDRGPLTLIDDRSSSSLTNSSYLLRIAGSCNSNLMACKCGDKLGDELAVGLNELKLEQCKSTVLDVGVM